MPQTRGHAALAAFGALTVWFALVQVITLGTSALGLPLARGGAIAGLVAGTAIAVAFGRWLVRGAAAASPGPEPGAAPDGLARGLAALAIAWAASVWLRLWVLALGRPPYDWDGLYYHIPAFHGWTLRGRVAWIGDVPDVPFVNLPMGVEAHTFFMHRILGGTGLLTAVNLWFWPLAFLALAVIAERLGARGRWRWLAGALIAGVPVVVCQSATAYTDPAFAATVMAALAAACVFVAADDLRPLPRTLLFGAGLGLMAGAKGTGAPFALVVLPAALAWALVAHGARAWRTWLARTALAAGVAFAVGGYWYVRNALHTGNPIHPIRLVFGAKVIAPGYDHVAFSEANLPAWLERVPAALRAPVSWLQLDAPIAGYAPVGGLGYVWPLALVATLFLIWKGVGARRDRGHAGAPGPRGEAPFLAAVLVLLFAVQTASWWSRFTIWLHALGLPALALVLYRRAASFQDVRATRGRLLRSALLIAVLGAAAWDSERTLAIEWRTGRIPPGQTPGRAYQSTTGRLFPGLAEDPLFERLLADSAVARSPWGSYGTLLGGVLAMPPGKRTIVVLPPDPTAADLDRLRARDIAWVVWDARGAGDVPRAIEDRAVEHRSWRPWPDESFHVLRLAGDGTPDVPAR